jgi:hypothetical protein
MVTLTSKKLLMRRATLDRSAAQKTALSPAAAPRKYRPTFLVRAGGYLFYGLMGFLVYAGWKTRHLEYLTAERGLGYQLGITGGTILLVLLLYPLRKKARFMQGWGPVKHWFRIHMALGVLAPVCILFHANFKLGSANSNVALFSMLAVAGSGLVGRFLYTRIHFGLYGSRATLVDLKNELANEEAEVNQVLGFAPHVRARLHTLAEQTLSAPGSLPRVVGRALFAGLKHRWLRGRLLREVDRELNAHVRKAGPSAAVLQARQKRAGRWIGEYMETLTRISEIDFFARLFSFWHVLHLPLFFMLLAAGLFHVFAVHAY